MNKKILLLILLLAGCHLEVAAASPSDPSALARQYYAAGEYKRAYDNFFVLFKNNPGDPEINFFLGRAALAKGDYEAAVMAFERVLIIDPAITAVKVELGKAFFHLGDIETAEQYFNEALEGALPDETASNLREFMAGTK